MARGSPIVPIRVPPLLLAMIDDYINRTAPIRKMGPFNRSTFILDCILERLEKPARSKASREKKRKAKREKIS